MMVLIIIPISMVNAVHVCLTVQIVLIVQLVKLVRPTMLGNNPQMEPQWVVVRLVQIIVLLVLPTYLYVSNV